MDHRRGLHVILRLASSIRNDFQKAWADEAFRRRRHTGSLGGSFKGSRGSLPDAGGSTAYGSVEARGQASIRSVQTDLGNGAPAGDKGLDYCGSAHASVACSILAIWQISGILSVGLITRTEDTALTPTSGARAINLQN